MSDKDLEVMEDAAVLETEDEDLLEFKADDEHSEVPDSSTTKTDEKSKGKGEPMPKTKAGMINAMVQNLTAMKKDDLKASYDKLMASMQGDEEDEDDEDIEEARRRDPWDSFGGLDGAIKRAEASRQRAIKKAKRWMKATGKSAEAAVKEFDLFQSDIEKLKEEADPLAKITAEDIDVSEDVDAIFNGSDLDEEFKEKVATIFEAAVVAKVNEQVEKFAIEVESDAEVTQVSIVEELTEKVDAYLDYVVQEWVEENKLAIEKGVRADMVEDFLKGLHNLFTEHYVDIPEEKVDVVEELMSRVDELEDKLNEETDKNVELLGQVKKFKREAVFAEATEDLTYTQVEKLRGLAGGVEFINEKDFSKKISMLKTHYFDIDEETETLFIDDENDPFALEEEAQGPTGAMAGYVNAISRSAKK